MTSEVVVEMMIEKAKVAGTVVNKIKTIDDALKYVVSLFENKHLKSIVSPDLDESDKKNLLEKCRIRNVDFLEPPFRNHVDSIDVGLTWADFGIAETGTLMVKSDAEELRLATMLSRIHVAMLHDSNIKQNMDDIEPELDKALKSESASYTAFITGPSRTADIERVLAIGVHGPIELHLLILKEC